jgi:hypothetical protein
LNSGETVVEDKAKSSILNSGETVVKDEANSSILNSGETVVEDKAKSSILNSGEKVVVDEAKSSILNSGETVVEDEIYLGPIMITIFWIIFVVVCGSILVFAAGKGKKGATKKNKKPISQGNLLRSIDNKTLEDR